MGRHYVGDIKGKFWFAVQDSDDASFFGGADEDELDEETGDVIGIHFSFYKGDKEDIEAGIQECEDQLGSWLLKLGEFFERATSYNTQILAKAIGADESDVQEMLVWYARLDLGKKILESVEKIGQCCFSAEV
jgi:hypothetical protein